VVVLILSPAVSLSLSLSTTTCQRSFAAGPLVDPTDHKAAASGLPPIDSLNVWPLISGQTTTSPRQELLINADTLIDGEWKVRSSHSYMCFSYMCLTLKCVSRLNVSVVDSSS
jgi:hypothetical protein